MKGVNADNNIFKWWILLASSVIILMTGIDATAVNLILAPLSMQLHIATTSLQWVMNVYLLVYAACIVIGGRLGDCFGQKRVLIAGLILFLGGSMVVAFSHSLFGVLSGRIIQGIGAALISPNSMSMIYRAFPKEQKGIATGVITSVLGASIAIGPFIGGLLTKLYSWRLVFFINFPLSIFAGILVILFVRFKVKREYSLKNIDLSGAVIMGLFLFSLVASLDLVDNIGVMFKLFLFLIIATIILLILFIINERKVKNPLLDVTVLKNRVISISCIIRFLYGMPIMTLVFVFALYLQHGLGYSALKAGFMFMPLTLMMVFLAPFIGKLVDKIGSLVPLLIGIIISVLAYWGLSIGAINRAVIPIIIVAGLVGIGLAFIRPALVTAIMKATPESKLGVISSIFNMMNTIGGSIGIVVCGVILGFYHKFGIKQQVVLALPVVMYFCMFILIITAFLVWIGIPSSKKANMKNRVQEER